MGRRRGCRVVVVLASLGGAAALLGGGAAHAQQARQGLLVSAGFGQTTPTDDVDGSGSGGLGEVEYIYRLRSWLSPRAYSGLVITSPQHDCGAGVAPCNVYARLLFLGVKARLSAPIPYVAPFVEIGGGISVGKASTQVGTKVNATPAGVMPNIPLALGLALGSQHQFELSFQLLFHPSAHQAEGAIALGVEFPLGPPPEPPPEP